MTNNNLIQNSISLSYSFSPIKNVRYNVSGMLGKFNCDLLKNFFPAIVSKRVNVIVSELVNNTLENIIDDYSQFIVDIKIDAGQLAIKVKNKVNIEQFEQVKSHIAIIKKSKDPKKLLSETIRERREKRLEGGLGLIRIASESKAKLSVSYNKSSFYMTITTKMNLKEEL